MKLREADPIFERLSREYRRATIHADRLRRRKAGEAELLEAEKIIDQAVKDLQEHMRQRKMGRKAGPL